MGLFTRRPPAPVTGHAADDAMLAQLARLRTDLTAPRRWDHFLYCADADGTRFLTARARHAGWQVEPMASGDEGIVASRSDLPVDASTVVEARAFFEALASQVAGGEYDGWGAEAR